MLGADTSTITVLGIETSCDETGIALFQGKRSELSQGTLLAERVHSQTDTHQAYGGVVPELAAREHTKSLPVLTDLVLREAGINLSDIDLIGVTTGPGLKGCLLTGILFAQGLALRHEIPLGAVNHLEGHILSVILDNPEIHFPFISLIVSGGHTELHYVSQVGDYALIARTSDDAAGEAFDKSANLLGIPYPGGAALAELADSFHGESRFTLP
ncbi:MAG: tRNA (adenosine(37)-N6)-threonylcarbamoyltransferase complex transferase subunit TsaD, partial [Bdellovibrionales bacterium]|nr:tRNA (adenosine(37)-N6)-threonylcarbamoyltransferase complex transferase subunit TsaD [Bdellovibrionales bacterium]